MKQSVATTSFVTVVRSLSAVEADITAVMADMKRNEGRNPVAYAAKKVALLRLQEEKKAILLAEKRAASAAARPAEQEADGLMLRKHRRAVVSILASFAGVSEKLVAELWETVVLAEAKAFLWKDGRGCIYEEKGRLTLHLTWKRRVEEKLRAADAARTPARVAAPAVEVSAAEVLATLEGRLFAARKAMADAVVAEEKAKAAAKAVLADTGRTVEAVRDAKAAVERAKAWADCKAQECADADAAYQTEKARVQPVIDAAMVKAMAELEALLG